MHSVCGLLPALVGKNVQKWPISVRLPLSFPFLSQDHQAEEHGGAPSAPQESLLLFLVSLHLTHWLLFCLPVIALLGCVTVNPEASGSEQFW